MSRRYPTVLRDTSPIGLAPAPQPLLSVSNPYIFLSRRQINTIIRARDVDVEPLTAAILLAQLDEIDPSYRQTALTTRYSPNIPLDILYYLAANRFVRTQAFPESDIDNHNYLVIRLFGSEARAEIQAASPQVIDKVAEEGGITSTPEVYTTQELRDTMFGVRRLSPPDRRRLERYQKFQQLDQRSKDTLLRFYGCDDLRCYMGKIEAPIEPYFDLALTDPQRVAKLLGIVVPFGEPVATYVRDNVLDYNNAVQRSNVRYPNLGELSQLDQEVIRERLSMYTDKELLDIFGVAVAYRSRQQLLQNLASLIAGNEIFFVPLRRRCRNEQTQLLSDTDDPTLRVFAFGTLNGYTCYEADELEASFGEYEGIFQFRIPGLQDEFTENDLNDLLILIQNSRRLRPLKQKIEQGLAEQKRMLGTMDDAQRIFRTLTQREKDVVRDYLETLFNAGMYMRRWQGTGCYPLSEEATRTDVEPAILSTPALQHLQDVYQSATSRVRATLDALSVVSRTQGRIQKSTDRIIPRYINPVYQGTECIRVASTRFVLTAYIYLQELFGYTVPNFDPQAIQYII